MPLVSAVAESAANEMGEAYSNHDVAHQFVRWTVDAISSAWDAEDGWSFVRGSHSLTTSSGVATYDLPVEVGTILVVYDEARQRRLMGASPQSLVRSEVVLSRVGTPSYWCTDGMTAAGGLRMRLWEVPSGATSYTLHYSKRAPELVETDVVPLPPELIRAVHQAVLARYFENADDAAAADRAAIRQASDMAVARRRYLTSPGIDRSVVFGDIQGTRLGHPHARVPTFITS